MPWPPCHIVRVDTPQHLSSTHSRRWLNIDYFVHGSGGGQGGRFTQWNLFRYLSPVIASIHSFCLQLNSVPEYQVLKVMSDIFTKSSNITNSTI